MLGLRAFAPAQSLRAWGGTRVRAPTLTSKRHDVRMGHPSLLGPTELRGQLEHSSAAVAQKATSSSAANPQRAVEIPGGNQDRAERAESIRATVLAFKIVKVG